MKFDEQLEKLKYYFISQCKPHPTSHAATVNLDIEYSKQLILFSSETITLSQWCRNQSPGPVHATALSLDNG